MSDSASWPDGVPVLPPPPDEAFILVKKNGRPEWGRIYFSLREAGQATVELQSPAFITRRGGKIIQANAAARALGIDPDGEQV